MNGFNPTFITTNNFSLSYDRVYKVEDNAENAKWNTYNKKLTSTSEKKLIPYGIELYYGSAYIIATRDFLQWATTDSVPTNLINWSRDLYSPDEVIWATLSRIYQKQQKITQSSNSIIELNYSNILPPPTQNLVWQKNDVWQNLVWQKIVVLSDSVQVEPQFSYARTVKWEIEVLKKKYPACQARFLLKDYFRIFFLFNHFLFRISDTDYIRKHSQGTTDMGFVFLELVIWDGYCDRINYLQINLMTTKTI